MSVMGEVFLNRKRLAVGIGVLAVAGLVGAGFYLPQRHPLEEDEPPEKRLFVEVKRAVTAQKLRLDNDQDKYLILAGIRTPTGDEPLFQEAKRRVNELLGDRKVRLRFDRETRRDRKGRLLAYVFVDDTFVNEELVREGLAYVRTTETAHRFSDRLLAAQAEARLARRGVWSQRAPGRSPSYVGDPKYGNFHRPSCEELKKKDPKWLVNFSTRMEAFDQGFAPCPKCHP